MTDRPILFSGEMVRAIQDGRKTVTRRVVKPTPGAQAKWLSCEHINSVPHGEIINGGWQMHHPLAGQTQDGVPVARDSPLGWVRSPYGQPGDFLWVRERQRVVVARSPLSLPAARPTEIRVRYEADGAESGWIPYPERLKGEPVVGKCLSYGGYRESSRLTLEVTSIRVERLQDITPADAIAEGIRPPVSHHHELDCETRNPVDDFTALWDSINGKRPGCSWESNPWVWAVGFKVGGE